MKFILCDRNQAMIDAWKAYQTDGLDVEIHHGEIMQHKADAIVSPANSFGFMDGGVDLVYSKFFGWDLQDRVQQHLAKMPFGECLVGQAFVAATNHEQIPYLICAPTMRVPMRIQDPADIFLATRAATDIASRMGMKSVIIPGMGTGCGQLHPGLAAKAMIEGIRAGKYGKGYIYVSWHHAQDAHREFLELGPSRCV